MVWPSWALPEIVGLVVFDGAETFAVVVAAGVVVAFVDAKPELTPNATNAPRASSSGAKRSFRHPNREGRSDELFTLEPPVLLTAARVGAVLRLPERTAAPTAAVRSFRKA
jgi:hypothetical protein